MKKQLITVLAGAALTALCSMPVFAGGWRQDGAGRWWYEKDTGSIAAYTRSWQKGSAGNWQMGTSAADNGWCANGWWWILDDQTQMMKCYYFDSSGYMLANTTTPDGFQVNEKGEWTIDGTVQTIYAPKPAAALRSDFDYTQYLPGNYEASAAARAQQNDWQKDAQGWWYKLPNGQWCANGWWWIFDTSIQGMKCYYFDSNGYMLTNTNTPDGYQVNGLGEWIVGGSVQAVTAPSARDAMTSYEVSRAQREAEEEEEEWYEEDEEDSSSRYDEDEDDSHSRYDEVDSGSGSESNAGQDSGQESDGASSSIESFLQAARDYGYGNFLYDTSGENVTVSIVEDASIDTEIPVLGASSDDWSDRVEQLHLIASDLEDLYAFSGLKGLLTVHVCAGSKGAVRLTSQNGSIVYNAAEDAGFERPESTQMNAFIEIVQNTLKNTDYSIEQDGTNVTICVLAGDIDSAIMDGTSGWRLIKEDCLEWFPDLYQSYQDLGIFGNLITRLCAESADEIRLDYENGTCTYDADGDPDFRPMSQTEALNQLISSIDQYLRLNAGLGYGEYQISSLSGSLSIGAGFPYHMRTSDYRDVYHEHIESIYEMFLEYAASYEPDASISISFYIDDGYFGRFQMIEYVDGVYVMEQYD